MADNQLTLKHIEQSQMKRSVKSIITFCLLIVCNVSVAQSTFFVSRAGSNSDSGSIENPWESISFGATKLQPGDTLFVREGTYEGYFKIAASGQQNNEISISSYLEEKVIIDGLSIPASPGDLNAPNLLTFDGEHVIFKGFELQFAALRTIVSVADHVTLDDLTIRNGYGTGISIFGASFNTVQNSIIYDLYDYDNATTGGGGGGTDGIKVTTGKPMPYPDTGYALLKNNTIYNISDDGIDTWSSRGNVLVGNRIFNVGFTNAGNGYVGPIGSTAGDGNGYKLGGGGTSGENTLYNNISYGNRVSGFDGNSGIGNILYNNTSYDDPIGFRALRAGYTLKNNIASNNSRNAFTFYDAYPGNTSSNSWELGIQDPQFISVNPDDSTFLQLSASSPAIDVGVDISLAGLTVDYKQSPRPKGLSFDIGAFEYQDIPDNSAKTCEAGEWWLGQKANR